MSTAVLISGQLRTFRRCFPTQRWQVFRHFEPDIHFFVSCVDDANADSAELLREHYKNVHIEKYQDPELPEIPLLAGDHAPYANAATHEKLLLQHWGNKRCYEFYRQHAQCDTVIRIRPDQFFHGFTNPRVGRSDVVPVFDEEAMPQRYVTVQHTIDPLACLTPWWGKFGGINDRFAIMGQGAAEAYFTMYDKIPQLLSAGCPFHPESLLKAALELAVVDIRQTLMASFSTLRENNHQRWPEVTSEDIAELIAANGRA